MLDGANFFGFKQFVCRADVFRQDRGTVWQPELLDPKVGTYGGLCRVDVSLVPIALDGFQTVLAIFDLERGFFRALWHER